MNEVTTNKSRLTRRLGLTAFNLLLTVLSTYSQDLCIPILTSETTTYYISNFKTDGGDDNIDNTTTGFGGSYSDFSSEAVSVQAGTTIDYTITIAGGGIHGSAIWVDWNDNDIFETTELVAFTNEYKQSPHIGSFLIPENTAAGIYRMRIVSDFLNSNPSSSSCEANIGEFEDYSIVVADCETNIIADLISPSNNVSNLQTSPTVTWEAVQGASSYTVYWNTTGDLSTAATATSTSTYFTMPPLMGTTTYYWWVKPNVACGNISSSRTFSTSYSEDVNMQNGRFVVECGKTINFYDEGGLEENYFSNNTTYTYTFTSENGNPLIIDFTDFNTEGISTDFMSIYDGTASNGLNLSGALGGDLSNFLPGPFTAHSGCMTIIFKTDVSQNKRGWISTISCCDEMESTTLITPENNATDVIATPTLTWQSVDNVSSYIVYWNTENDISTANSAISLSNSFTLPRLLGSTTYYWWIAPNITCGAASEPRSFNTEFITTINMQNGRTDVICGELISFYDEGGASANYSSNSRTLTYIFSSDNGSPLSIAFSEFVTEICDTMLLFDGESTSAVKIAGPLGGDLSSELPGPFTANSGTLTIKFTTDRSITDIGWSAIVKCCGNELVSPFLISPSNNEIGVSIIPNISWSEVDGAESYIVYRNIRNDISTATSEIVTTNSCTLPMLLGTTKYYWWVEPIVPCSEVSSVSCFTTEASNCVFMQNGTTVLNCGTTIAFYDEGGIGGSSISGSIGNYSATNTTYTHTFISNNATPLSIIFYEFQTEDAEVDYINIYDGLISPETLIVSHLGGNLTHLSLGPYTAYSGTMIVTFRTDASVNKLGWAASVSCATAGGEAFVLSYNTTANCSEARVAPASHVGYGFITLSSDIPVCSGMTFNGWNTNQDGSGTLYLPDDGYNLVETDTLYAQYVQGSTMSIGSTMVFCGTDLQFYDSGGISGNYSSNENLTHSFISCNGNPISITFQNVDIEENHDGISIGDGVGGLLNLNSFYNTLNGSTYTSNTGKIVFNFSSDEVENYAGWEAIISCDGTCAENVKSVECGNSYVDSVYSNVATSNCFGLQRYGAVNYNFTPAITGEYVFNFESQIGNMDFFISGFDIDCGNMLGTSGRESYSAYLTRDNTYNILLASVNNSKAKSILTIDCPSASQQCDNVIEMSCGSVYSGVIPATGNAWTYYSGCNVAMLGGEVVYSIEAPRNGLYTFSVQNIGATTDGIPYFYLLSSCGDTQTTKNESCWISGIFEIYMIEGTVYYLVADNNSMIYPASYSISVTCPEVENPCCDPDLIAVNVNGENISVSEDGYYYVDVCLGNSANISVSNLGTCNYLYSWTLKDKSTILQIAEGESFNTMIFTEAKGYDISLVVNNSTGLSCNMTIPIRVRVSQGISMHPQSSQYFICAGNFSDMDVSEEITSDIVVDLAGSHVTNSLGVGKKVFLPDGKDCGNGCSYTSSVEFTEFAPSATIQSAADVDNLRINIEHSFIGDIYVALQCPNGQSATIMKKYRSGYSDCTASIPADDFGWDINYSTSAGSYFGDADDENDNRSNKCDSLTNPAGIGWNYIWSENPNYSYASGGAKVYQSINHTNGKVNPSNVMAMTNIYRPDNSFSELVGCPLNGIWSLVIIDGFSIDNGYVFDWQLTLADDLMPGTWTYNVDLADAWVVCDWNLSRNHDTITIEPPANAYGITDCEVFFEDDFGCITSDNISVNINPSIIINPIDDITECRGTVIPEINISLENQNIVDEAGGNVVYSWTNSNPAIGLPARGSSSVIPSFTLAGDGSATITITATYVNSSTVCSNSESFSITVGNSPFIYGANKVCFGETLQLHPNDIGGFWSVINESGTATISDSGLLNTVESGVVYAIYNLNSCVSNPFEIIIAPQPQVNILSNAETLDCNVERITLTATGANNFEWNTMQNTASIIVTNPGIYSVTATSGTCTNSFAVTINQNILVPNIEIIGDNIICEGEQTTITANTDFPADIADYSWSGSSFNHAASIIVSPLETTEYTLTVTSHNGCWSTAAFDLTVVPLTVPVFTQLGPYCEGEISEALPTNSNNENTISGFWSPSAISTLNPGITEYIFTSTTEGCYANASMFIETVAQPRPIIVASNPDINCEESTILLSVSGGSSYLWSNGNSSDSEISVTEIGEYFVTVTNGDCMASASINISLDTISPLPIIVNNSGSNELNCGYTVINLIALGGNSYLWSNGTTTDEINITYPGDYSVTVIGANGCTSSQNITITQNTDLPLLSLTNNTGTTELNCNVTSINVTASGGSQYLWSDGSTSSTRTFTEPGTYFVTMPAENDCNAVQSVVITQNTEPPIVSITSNLNSFTCVDDSINLIAGTGTSYLWSNSVTSADNVVTLPDVYSVTVTASNGCTASQSISIAQDITPPELNVISNSGSFELNCILTSINLSATGANSYLWSDGSFSSTNIVTNPGTYSVTATAANGCTSSQSVSVIQNTTPAAATIVNNSGTTVLDCNLYEIEAVAQGGIFYSWSNGANTANNSLSVVGTYAVTVTGANGCTSTQSINITRQPELTASISNVNPILCHGGNTSAAVFVSGGTAPYSYSWSNGGTSATATALTAGSYFVTVTDASQCTATASAFITEPTMLLATYSATNALCFGNTTSATIFPIGGSPEYSVSWSDNMTGMTNNSIPANINYGYTVTDQNGCTFSSTITTIQPQQLRLSLTGSNLTCNGISDGTISVSNLSGGVPNYNYHWSNGSSDTNISGLTAGTYSLTITDANQCATTASYSIIEPATLSLNLITTNLNCGVSMGSASALVTGGTPQYNYVWSNGNSGSTINGLLEGSYSVEITDANGCTNSKICEIVRYGQIDAQVTVLSNLICNGDSSASMVANSVMGVEPIKYLWSNGDSTSVISNLGAGFYSVELTDFWGCKSFANAIIAMPEAISVDVLTENAKCFGSNDGSLSVTVNGGSYPYSFQWNNNMSGGNLMNLHSGTYVVTVIDAEGCSISKTVIIESPEELKIDVNITNLGCFGSDDGRIEISGRGGVLPYIYTMTDGSGSIVGKSSYNNLSQGVYYLTIDDALGCQESYTAVIDQPQILTAEVSVSNPTCIGNRDGMIEIVASGGTKPYLYGWEDHYSDFALVNGLYAGTYNVEIIDANNCIYKIPNVSLEDESIDCLRIPNVYTPNGDGINDIWEIENIQLFPDANVYVFNRWGQQIYAGRGNSEPWDGKYKDDFVPAGVYLYIIDLQTAHEIYEGTITIVY